MRSKDAGPVHHITAPADGELAIRGDNVKVTFAARWVPYIEGR